jgi:CubicO group peptidase (beta-lactamase class C family)
MNRQPTKIRLLRPILFAALLFPFAYALSGPVDLTPKQELRIKQHIADGDFVGLVMVSVSGDEVAHSSFGQVSVDQTDAIEQSDQFEIGSITKAFTNLLLAEMVAKNVVGYGSTIADLMPDTMFDNPAVGDITLLQLATHTSGLPRLPANFTQDDPADPYKDYDIEALRVGVMATRSGQQLSQKYAYSNFGVGLLGYLLGQMDGTNYQQALKSHVLDPLGMTTATFDDTENLLVGHHDGERTSNWHLNAMSAAGELRASGVELAKLLRPWLSDGFSGLQHDVAADLVIAASVGGNIRITPVWHVVGEGGTSVYWHNGGTGGFRSFVGFNPATGQGRVVLSNTDYDVTELGLQLLSAQPLDRGNGELPGVTDGKVDFSDFHGHFAITPTIVLSVFEARGQLLVQLTGQQALRLAASGEDEFTLLAVDAKVSFERDKAGVVQTAVLHQNGNRMPGKRVSEAVIAKAFTEIEMGASDLEDYTGIYKLTARALFRVRVKNGRLTVRLADQPAIPVFPFAQDQFFYKVVDAQLTFNRDNGQVVSLTLHQNGVDQVAPKK